LPVLCNETELETRSLRITENRRLATAAAAIVTKITTFSKERRFLVDSLLRKASKVAIVG